MTVHPVGVLVALEVVVVGAVRNMAVATATAIDVTVVNSFSQDPFSTWKTGLL